MNPRGRRSALAFGVLLLAWAAAGVRRVDPAREIVAVDGVFPGSPVLVTGRFAVAPPGLARLVRFPSSPAEVTLPRSDEAGVRSRDGTTFGLDGTATIHCRVERWRDAILAARVDGDPVAAAAREASTVFVEARREAPLLPTAMREFEARLRDSLERRGFALDGMRLRGLDVRTVREGETRPLADRKVLVVGLDGADWAIIDPLIAQGRLPNLARLVREGVRARLLTISPMISPVVWTSVATGVEPARHGVLDFLVPAGRSGAGEPVTSTQRRVPAVWDMLSERGASVGVTAWWATWPADRLHGYVVSDRVAYQLFGFRPEHDQPEGKTWPAELWDAIRPSVVRPEDVPWSEVTSYLGGARRDPASFDAEEREMIQGLATLLASGKTYLAAALEARRRYDPRFEAVYFEGTDTVGHLFMRYRPPRLAGVSETRVASFGPVVDRYYEEADRMLGRVLEGRERGWTIVVLSDHGFATDQTRPLTTDSRIGHGPAADWHRRFGILILAGEGVKRGARVEEAGIYDIAPTLLAIYGQPVPASWPGRVLADAFEPAWLDRYPVVLRPDDPKFPRDRPTDTEARDADAEDLRAKLESLGYIGPAAGKTPLSTANNRGVALLAGGRFAEAAAAFENALRDSPDQPMLLVNYGIALRLKGDVTEAERQFRKAFPSRPVRRQAGFQLAQIRLDAGDLRGAEEILRAVLVDEPGAWDVHNTLGIVLERRGEIAGAEAAYRTAAGLDTAAAEPRNNLGNLARTRGHLDEAEAWYRKAIEADPYFMGAYNNLALVFQDRGEAGRAIELYGRALSKAPKNAVVMNNLASLYFSTGEMAQARRLWEDAVAVDPTYVSPKNNLAGLALTEGRLDDAEKLLREALAREPEYGDARINLSLVERARGDFDSARRELERAARDPRSRLTALVQRGALELQAGRPADAIVVLREARVQFPASPELLNALGEAERRMGHEPQAVEAWRASLRLRPGQGNVAEALRNLEKRD